MLVNDFLMKVITKCHRELNNIHQKAARHHRKASKQKKLHNQNKVIKLFPQMENNIVINFGFSDEFNSEGKKRALIYCTKIACVKRNQSFSKSVHSLLTATLSKFDHSVWAFALEFIFHKTSPEEVPPCWQCQWPVWRRDRPPRWRWWISAWRGRGRVWRILHCPRGESFWHIH